MIGIKKWIEKLQKDNNASTAKIAFWYTVSNVLAQGMAAICTPIFTRLLTKTEFGQYSNFNSWMSILVIIVTLDFSTSIARAKYDFDERMEEYLSSIVIVGNVATTIAYLIIELNSAYFTKLFSMDMFYIRFLFIYLFFNPVFQYLKIKNRVYRRYKLFVLLSIVYAILQTVTSVILVIVMQDKLLGRISGTIIPVTILNIILWIYVVTKGKRIRWDCIKYACTISIPLIPHSLSGILLGNSDRIMITNICGAEQNAIYSLAYQISLLGNLIWTSMNQAWAPWLYDNMHAGDMEEIRKNSKIYLGVFVVLIIGMLLVSPELIWIMGGSAYYEARYAMPPIILGCAMQFIYGMYVNLEIYNKKTFTISVGTVAAAVLNIGLNSIFIPKYGYLAAAYTTLVGYFALFVFHYIIVQFTTKYADIYDRRFVFGIILFLNVFGFAVIVLYNYSILRYSVIVIYCVILVSMLWKYKDILMQLFKSRN